MQPAGDSPTFTPAVTVRLGARRQTASCHITNLRHMIVIMSQSIEPFLGNLRGRQLHFENGRSLFLRGDPVTDMHFVIKGSIHLVRHQSDGSALTLQRAGPGAMLAEASLYSRTYHCDAVAFGAADTCVYTKVSLKRLLAKSPEFSNVWASYLAQELQRSRLRSEILSLRTVSERLDAWIAWNGGSFSQKGEWKIVANQIGVSPEALYREIAKRRD
jgi:CRP-like cAMP-binding protein